MTSRKKQYISAFDGFKVLRLPYKQGGDDKRRFSVYFFLPDAKDGLPAFVDKVSSEPGFLENHLPRSKVQVGVFRIPKFKISFGFEASQALKQLGLVLPFSGEGGLTEMVDFPSSLSVETSAFRAFSTNLLLRLMKREQKLRQQLLPKRYICLIHITTD